MKNLKPNIKLLIVFVIAFAGTAIISILNTRTTTLPYSASMREANSFTQELFNIIDSVKREKEIFSDTYSNVPNSFMIGNDWSDITTSLGSLEAKETASNPDFAALVVRWLHEADIRKDDKIGVILSGSFPAISISVLAALQTLDIDAIVISSLGASTYGANQPEATWLDMERWLRRYGNLRYTSILVSMGADQDNGNDLSEEGKVAMNMAAERNKTELYIPESLKESIVYKTELFTRNNISLLINVGGNMAALGSCSHSLNIPNGLNFSMKTCSDPDRGIVPRISEKGIPFIQFLYIKELAVRYGMDMMPGSHYAESTNLYNTTTSGKTIHIIILICCIIPVTFLKKEL